MVAAAARHVRHAGRLLEVDESGGEARAYLLDGGVVVKTQRPHRLRPRTSLAKEALFLEELDRTGDFPVPTVFGHGHVDGIEYLCLSRVAGTASRHVQLGAAQRSALLQALGRVLRSVHAIDQSRLRASGLLPGDDGPSHLHGASTMHSRDWPMHCTPTGHGAATSTSCGWPNSRPAACRAAPSPSPCTPTPARSTSSSTRPPGASPGSSTSATRTAATRPWTSVPGAARPTPLTCWPATGRPGRSRTASKTSSLPS